MADQNNEDIDFAIEFPSPKPVSDDEDDGDWSDDRPRAGASVESLGSQPVIVLLGWMDCEDYYLSKYSDIYAEMCVTIRYCTQMSQVTDGRAHYTATKLLEILMDMDYDHNPIFLHVFSNGGGMLYREFIHLIHNDPEYQHIRICGTIFDSCPSQPRLQSISRFYSKKVSKNSFLQKIVYYIGLLILHIIAFFRHMEWLKSRDSIVPILSYLDDMKNDPSRCPQLFLYSIADRLVDYRMIEEVMRRRCELGVDLSYKKWTDSPHVQHLRLHRDEYKRTCTDFVNRGRADFTR